MALPELLINSPTPGSRVALTTLKAELSEAGTEMEWEATVPTSLQKAGQYRVIIGSEIILCEAKAESTKKVKILTRGAESSTKVAHAAGSEVYHVPTAQGLQQGVLEKPRFQVKGEKLKFANKGLGELEKLKPSTVDWDNESWWVAGENKYVPKAKGVYLVGCGFEAQTTASEDGKVVDLAILKNGTKVIPVFRYASPVNGVGAQISGSVTVEMNGTTDALEVAGNSNQASIEGIVVLWVVRAA